MEATGEITLTLPILNCYLAQYEAAYAINPSQEEAWLYSTAQALYYAYPIVLCLALVLSLLASIVTAKMATESHDCYITAFNICATMMLLCVAAAQLPTYVSGVANSAEYQAVLPYIFCFQNWFWYATTWTLATAALERGFANLTDSRGSGSRCYGCGRVHGALVSSLVIFVSLVNALPQFWEYEAVSVPIEGPAGNCSVTGVQTVAELVSSQEYYAYHWYTTVVSSILPYILLPILVPAIVCSRGYYYTSVTSVSSKTPALKYHGGAHESSSPMKEQMVDEKDFNRMLAAMLALYLLLGAPYTALRMTAEDHVRLHMLDEEPQLRTTLAGLFELLFWFVFLVAFFLQLIVSHNFRGALSRLCRCKKEQQRYYY